MTNITIPLPAELQCHIRNLEHENFCLWMFISQNDLWEDAREFLSDSRKFEFGRSFPQEFPF